MSECVICLEIVEDPPKLNCSHRFHLECIQRHFKQECPLCRSPHQIKVNGKLEVEVEPLISMISTTTTTASSYEKAIKDELKDQLRDFPIIHEFSKEDKKFLKTLLIKQRL